MNQSQAETAVTGAALVVGGVYIYRRLAEPDTEVTTNRLKQFAGAGPVLPVGPFVVGWGFTFLVLALMAQVNPPFGGNFAILVAAGAVLGNGESVFQDLDKQLGGSSTKAGAGGGSNPASTAPVQTLQTGPAGPMGPGGVLNPQYPGRVVVSPGFVIAPTTTH